MNTADEDQTIELSMDEIREVTGYAVACAEPVLAIFERDCPDDLRPRAVLDEARRFAAGGKRTKALRMTALDAHRAARAAAEMRYEAAADAARAAGHAGGAAYLHPLAKATQGGHILMSAAHAARALELDAGDDRNVGDEYIKKATGLASPIVVNVLTRYPPAPSGRGRAGELWRKLDASLRQHAIDR
ncbi:putative immunity protein [Nocardia sp. NPDC050793]|uniref:putative immunity protein n=1 Tax=Nocardia sp. NPDC050793 TaxID=3155159 RepID=UPI0033D1FED1